MFVAIMSTVKHSWTNLRWQYY